MNISLHIVILALLVLVLFTLVDPFMYWMPSMVQTVSLTLAAGLLVIFAGLLLREKAGDERETLHRMYAGRAGYLAGISILTLALVVQGFSHAIDFWVPLALVAMVFAKTLSRWRAERSN